jgi:hypothetical protein
MGVGIYFDMRPIPPPVNPFWTLEEGIVITRLIEECLIPMGYHCCLGGSVLHKGQSEKDLDIFIYPHNVAALLEAEVILAAVESVIPGGMAFGACNPEYQERDAKNVWWSYGQNNRRIDFFFLL